MKHPSIIAAFIIASLSAFAQSNYDYATSSKGSPDKHALPAADASPTSFSLEIKELSPDMIFNEATGYGFEHPGIFSITLPDGNYKVTLTIGDAKRKASTVVRAECRRLMLDRIDTRKGELVERSFIVNKRSPAINSRDTVKLNPREVNTMSWDDKLSLEFNGSAPTVKSIKIEPADSVTTIFLCGNSTVVDQPTEPWASWGQIIPAYFDNDISIANHAESGESISSFLARKRFDKILSIARPGDWIFVEFGHNDQKEKGPGSGAYYNFTTNLKVLVDKARQAKLNILFITPTARRAFDENGLIQNTHGDYPDAMRAVAKRENVPLIELNEMTKTLYEAMGIEGSKKAFVHYPAKTFPHQTKALADNTHFNPYGATQVAKCIIEGLRKAAPQLAAHILRTERFNPSTPDDFQSFQWPPAPLYSIEKPLGN